MNPSEPSEIFDALWAEGAKGKIANHQALNWQLAQKLVAGGSLSPEDSLKWIGSFAGSMEAAEALQIKKGFDLRSARDSSQEIAVAMREGAFSVTNVNKYLDDKKTRLEKRLDELNLETNSDEIKDTLAIGQDVHPLQLEWLILNNIPKLVARPKIERG